MKCLILGASGLVGWNLLQQAKTLGHESIGTYRSHPLPDLLPLSTENESDVSDLLQTTHPDVVFYCGGWAWVDGCEGDPARAYLENADQPARVARGAVKSGARFVYFSTSYIFDGVAGPYAEDAEPRPLSVYGNSKLRGERAVMEATEGTCLIARTMGVYGEEPQQKNFVYQVRRALSAGRTFRVPNDQWGNVTHAGDIARMSLKLIDLGQGGVWNLAGPDPDICRSDLAYLIAKSYGLPEDLIEPVTTATLGQPAPRPRQAGLLIEKAMQATSIIPQGWVKIP
jgi:dTDP-4-dehydrorhamnose reductase